MLTMTKKKISLPLFLCILVGILFISPALTGCADIDTLDYFPTGHEDDNDNDNNNSNGVSVAGNITSSGRAPGYYSAVYAGENEYGAIFLLGGTDGRLDRVFEDGTVENIPLPVEGRDLTTVFVRPEIILVGGYSGALVYSRDGKVFEHGFGVGDFNILDITAFQGKYYASTTCGAVLSSADGVSWVVAAQLSGKPLISIAAASRHILAITGDTDIFNSVDGENWEHQNYNRVYYGLAPELSFRGLVNLYGSFILTAYQPEEPGTPVIMDSRSGGEVWSNIPIRKINERPAFEFYPLTVNAVINFWDDLLVACDNGKILTLDSCATCHQLTEVSSFNLHSIAVSENIIIIAGDNFEFMILNPDG